METGGSGGGGGEDIHGLKFGKKIYFEQDATAGGSRAAAGGGRKGKGAAAGSSGVAGAASSAGGSSGGAVSTAVTAAGAGAAATPPRAATPPICQVEGCGVDLSGAKPYYCRHKVCTVHSKTPVVVVAGIEQRFCQQCSRFHQLPEFDQGKRSCRRRLAGHNERRRRPPPGPLTSRFGRLAASFQEPGRFRSFLLDFSYPRVSSSAMDAWPGVQPGDRMSSAIQWQGSHELRPHRGAVAGYGDHAYIGPGGSVAGASSMQHPAFELPPGGCVAGVATDSSCALSLLSTQPWDTTTQSGSHHRCPAMSTASAFEGTTVSPSVMASSYAAASTWSGSRVHESARNLHHHHSSQEEDLHMVHPGSVHHGNFSGELELALQGSGPSNPPQVDHGSGGTFGHSSNAVNWSL